MCELIGQYRSHGGGSGSELSRLIFAMERLSEEVAKLCDLLASRQEKEG